MITSSHGVKNQSHHHSTFHKKTLFLTNIYETQFKRTAGCILCDILLLKRGSRKKHMAWHGFGNGRKTWKYWCFSYMSQAYNFLLKLFTQANENFLSHEMECKDSTTMRVLGTILWYWGISTANCHKILLAKCTFEMNNNRIGILMEKRSEMF